MCWNVTNCRYVQQTGNLMATETTMMTIFSRNLFQHNSCINYHSAHLAIYTQQYLHLTVSQSDILDNKIVYY